MTTGYAGRVARAAGLAAVFVGLALGLVAAVTAPRVAGAAQKDKAAPAPPAGAKAELVGAAVCQKCHQENAPETVKEYKETQGFRFIRLWENKVWDVHDLHRTAYLNILTKRSADDKNGEKPNATAQRMEDKLRQYKTHPKYADPNYTVATDPACLACHASANEPPPKDALKTWTKDSFLTSDGVGCEMCHGHGSLYRDKHQENKLDKVNAPEGAIRLVPWRDWAPEAKKAWGLVNLRSHSEATARCASCHVGNTDEGRFVTHDMYAAGHPPLPPFDLMAYTREQPRHWGLPSEMPYLSGLAKSDPAKALAVFNVRAGESHVARRFAESALATLGATAALGGQLADEATAKKDGLDFAAFDCYSCHHNLKYPSERQDRGYVGRPGRPLYRPAAFATARLVLDHAAGMPEGAALKGAVAELDALELKLADAFTIKTYGDPDAVKKATTELAAWSETARKKLDPVKYTPDQVRKLFDKVAASAADAKKPIGDPEVAQLLTWAVETLYLDLNPSDKKEPPAALTELRTKLEGTIVTRLRPNAAFYHEQGVTGGLPGPTVESVDSRLRTRMDVFNSFRGEPFRKAFTELKAPEPK